MRHRKTWVARKARVDGLEVLHVAHIMIDGSINGERLKTQLPDAAAQRGKNGQLKIGSIAEACWQLRQQHKFAGTRELALRPFRGRSDLGFTPFGDPSFLPAAVRPPST
jgi:hypothetical protein